MSLTIMTRSSRSRGIPCGLWMSSVPLCCVPGNRGERQSTNYQHGIDRLDGAVAAVGGKDHNGAEGRLQGAVEVREALEVQHVHLLTARV